MHEDQTCEDDEEAEQFKQDEEVSHSGYPVAMVREKENTPTLKSNTRVVGVVGVVVQHTHYSDTFHEAEIPSIAYD